MNYMRTFVAEPRKVVPEDPIRRDAAKLLLVAAVEFIVSHELWHILGGHLRWHVSRTAEPTLAEVRKSDYLDNGLTSQAMEMDADGFAIWFSLQRTLALAAAEHNGGSLSQVVNTPMQAILVTFICSVILVGTFLGEAPASSDWAALTHPPAGVRHGMFMTAVDRSLRHLGMNELIQKTTGNKAWLVAFANSILQQGLDAHWKSRMARNTAAFLWSDRG